MTAGATFNTTTFADSPVMAPPSVEYDTMRGRKRDRSVTRGDVRSIRCPPSDSEASNLRGRSRRRATSPALGLTSRASSPRRVMSPTRRRFLHARLRREHCPSRVASPAEHPQMFRRRQRTRSRSRGPRLELELEMSRHGGDVLSSLRNEVLANQDATEEEKSGQ